MQPRMDLHVCCFCFRPEDVQALISGKLALRYAGRQVSYVFFPNHFYFSAFVGNQSLCLKNKNSFESAFVTAKCIKWRSELDRHSNSN